MEEITPRFGGSMWGAPARADSPDPEADTEDAPPSDPASEPGFHLPRWRFGNPVDLLRRGVKLNKTEAADYRTMLGDAILTWSDGLDAFITRTNTERAEAVIWSTITQEEAQLIADAFVDAGVKYAQFAFVVRQMGRSYIGLKIGVITVPRFYQTMEFYALHGGFSLWSRLEY